MSDDATKGMEGSWTWWLLGVALRMLARYCGTKEPLVARRPDAQDQHSPLATPSICLAGQDKHRRGGMGEVHKAVHMVPEALVAAKRAPQEDKYLLSEAQVYKDLQGEGGKVCLVTTTIITMMILIVFFFVIINHHHQSSIINHQSSIIHDDDDHHHYLIGFFVVIQRRGEQVPRRSTYLVTPVASSNPASTCPVISRPADTYIVFCDSVGSCDTANTYWRAKVVIHFDCHQKWKSHQARVCHGRLAFTFVTLRARAAVGR